MIVLDTNDLSARIRPTPEPRGVEWLATQPASS